MWYYIFSSAFLILFFANAYEWWAQLHILVGIILLFCSVFIKTFLDNLDRQYYYDKKYLWNFALGMLLVLVFMTSSILYLLGHIKFIIYFIFLWPLSFTLYFYGIKRLLYLKLSEGTESEHLQKRYKVIKNVLQLCYIGDIAIILLYVLLIWDGRI